jgi:5-methylthioribose kinase
MSYLDLDTDKAKKYVAERTSLFAPGTDIHVRELGRNDVDGDGYVNHVYRAWDDSGHSVIVKQAKPFLKMLGKGTFPMPVDRNGLEIDIVKIRSAIVPQYIPKLLHADRENNLFISEDCGRLGIMRFGISKGHRYPRFPFMMGEFIAKCNFYTSEIHLDQRVHKELGRKFTSPFMSLIMEDILFLRKTLLDDVYRKIERNEPEPVHKLASDIFWDRRDVRLELMKLRDIYMKKQECLVHGDLHTSNTMIGDEGMKIIDMEYTHMGPFSSDSGYLLGNLVYTYDTWFYHGEWTESERARFREEVLGYVRDTLAEYARVFTECWERDAKGMFREYPEYLAEILATYLKETCGFMGSQICGRVGGYAETFDFDAVTDPVGRNRARAMAMSTAYSLIMRRNEITSPDDIVQLIRDSADAFREKIGEA